MDITTFLILILATWRITSLFVNEDGPLNMFARLRFYVGIKYNSHNEPYGSNFLSDLMACIWCMSVWIGLGLAIAYLTIPDYTTYFCLPFALSAGAIITEKMTNG